MATDYKTKKQSVLSGQFIDLPNGLIHFELSGPENAQTVVLVHGFSISYYSWDHTFDFLVRSGFRVLRYDAYGRGYSDKPLIKYSKHLYDHLLLELLSALNIHSPIDLVAHSMGGAVSVVFSNNHPNRIRRLCLISPAGMPMPQPATLKIIKIPIVGEAIMKFWGDQILTSGLRMDLFNPNRFPEYFENYTPQLRYPGFKYSLLSTLRSDLLYNLKKEYIELGKKNIDTLLIWGKEDKVIPYSQHEKIIKYMPQIKFNALENVGHASHYEFPELVNPLIISFLTNDKT